MFMKNYSNSTLQYYNKNAQVFYSNTINADMHCLYEKFLNKLQNNNILKINNQIHILDFGCGSGRDSIFFKSKGFQVTAIDGSIELANIASTNIGQEDICEDFVNFHPNDTFDAIWACASLLHLEQAELPFVVKNLLSMLKNKGILYMSFKYGTKSTIKNGRLFTDMNTESLTKLLKSIGNNKILDIWVTNDVRTDHANEKWINSIVSTTD